MRNLLLAMMALAVCFSANTVSAAPHDDVIQDAAKIVEQSVPAPPEMEAPEAIAAPPQQAQTESTGASIVATHDVQPQVVHQYKAPQQPAVQYQYHQYRRPAPKKQNVFQKLMELERRKNAWLRKTFLNK